MSVNSHQGLSQRLIKTDSLSVEALQNSHQLLTDIIQQLPHAIAVLEGPDYRIKLANANLYEIWRLPEGNRLGEPVFEAFPSIANVGLKELLDQVRKNGIPVRREEQPFELVRNGEIALGYISFVYSTLKTEAELPDIMVMATDVTEQVLAKRKAVEAEAQLQTIIASLPSATVLFRGPTHIVEMPSKVFIDIIDRGPDVSGKPLGELMPELESQSFLKILEGVYNTGQSFRAFGTPVSIRQQDGSVTRDFFDLIYTPLFDDQNEVYAILSVATNVTDVILAQQQVEKSEAVLRGAIELAKLGTWSYDVQTGITEISDRLRSWFGLNSDEVVTAELSSQLIQVADQPLVKRAIQQAVANGSDGLYDMEYVLDAVQTGQERIIHLIGRIQLDQEGQPSKLVGTAQDVTEQRNIQIALERQVQERTEELATINEELTATNEELTAKNEEYAALNEELVSASEDVSLSNRQLEEINIHLTRSNQNLEQFAYIASHDLQEPLRKIQQFGDLLKNRLNAPSTEETIYLDRMQTAASRMSTLIKDLLAFSRISTSQAATAPVPLNQVINEVLDDLSVVINETKAQLQIDSLPTVQGDRSQLGQLLLNLLSNALKFSRQTVSGTPVTPHIAIHYRKINAFDLPTTIKPTKLVDFYHQLEVIDNGIGFDEKYTDRIFQVFQRLHGKNEFSGTGIGLAIVQKIISNHGGAIKATSQPGKGAIFTIYLPF